MKPILVSYRVDNGPWRVAQLSELGAPKSARRPHHTKRTKHRRGSPGSASGVKLIFDIIETLSRQL